MNFGVLQTGPRPGVSISRPSIINPKGNVYKIPISHTMEDGKVNKVEIWATREAMYKHLNDQGIITEATPKAYEMQKFARQVYEKQLRANNGVLQHQGILVTTDDVKQGNPKLWPSAISHPEFKLDEGK